MATTTEIACPNCEARNRRVRPDRCHVNPSRSSRPMGTMVRAVQSRSPALEHLAKQRAGSLRVIKVNVDNEPAISAKLGLAGGLELVA